MSKRIPIRLDDMRGIGRLAIDATLGVTELVENLHQNISRVPGVLGPVSQARARGITGLVYRSIRSVTHLVGGSVDLALSQLAGLLNARAKSPIASSDQRDALLAALNGVLGDHLAATANPLATPMQFRRDGMVLAPNKRALHAAIAHPTAKIVLLIHGLCMNDRQWLRHGHDHGAALAIDGGYTPVYLSYNSGLHVSSNGQTLAGMLEHLLERWPVRVDELVILAHSMGGLIARSACHYAGIAVLAWPQRLRALVFLGTPHDGAPLERGGSWIDQLLSASPYTAAFARLGKIRSAGITDLRHGSVLDEDWQSHDRFARQRRPLKALALPPTVACYAMAASIARKAPVRGEKIPGDGLVPVASALGLGTAVNRRLHIPRKNTWIGYGMHHLDLLDRATVYARLRRWLIERQ